MPRLLVRYDAQMREFLLLSYIKRTVLVPILSFRTVIVRTFRQAVAIKKSHP